VEIVSLRNRARKALSKNAYDGLYRLVDGRPDCLLKELCYLGIGLSPLECLLFMPLIRIFVIGSVGMGTSLFT
jgi:hypothetical protein